jgi:hypothetical protein
MYVERNYGMGIEWIPFEEIEGVAAVFNCEEFTLEKQESPSLFPLPHFLDYPDREGGGYKQYVLEDVNGKPMRFLGNTLDGEEEYTTPEEWCMTVARAEQFDRTLWLNKKTLLAWNSREEGEDFSTVMVLKIFDQ